MKTASGRFDSAAFCDLIAAPGPRARVIGSITAGIKRYELPVLDFNRPKDRKLRAKIVSLPPFFLVNPGTTGPESRSNLKTIGFQMKNPGTLPGFSH